MAKTGVAKLFRNGRSQGVRLPKWFAKLDRLNSESFMKKGRKQPAAPRRKIFG
jgi:virulence-associated protein VagC